MTGIILAVIHPCIPKPDICIVVLVRILKVGLSLDIIPLCHRNEERVDNILHII